MTPAFLRREGRGRGARLGLLAPLRPFGELNLPALSYNGQWAVCHSPAFGPIYTVRFHASQE
jgi:hypothetical protein